MLINVEDDKENNILIFTPKEKMHMFNKYRISNKKGMQHIPLVRSPLKKIHDEYLKNIRIKSIC